MNQTTLPKSSLEFSKQQDSGKRSDENEKFSQILDLTQSDKNDLNFRNNQLEFQNNRLQQQTNDQLKNEKELNKKNRKYDSTSGIKRNNPQNNAELLGTGNEFQKDDMSNSSNSKDIQTDKQNTQISSEIYKKEFNSNTLKQQYDIDRPDEAQRENEMIQTQNYQGAFQKNNILETFQNFEQQKEKYSSNSPFNTSIGNNQNSYSLDQTQTDMKGNFIPTQTRGNPLYNTFGSNQNPHFHSNPPGNQNIQNFQKRKPKTHGKFSNYPQSSPNQNWNQNNLNFNNNIVSNMNPNLYNRKSSGNMGSNDPNLNPPFNPQMSPTMQNTGKFNKNQTKQYPEKNIRGFVNPNQMQNPHINLNQSLHNPQTIPQTVTQSDMIGNMNINQNDNFFQDPLKLQPNAIGFNNQNANLISYTNPSNQFIDIRNMNNLLLAPPFALSQQNMTDNLGMNFQEGQVPYPIQNAPNNHGQNPIFNTHGNTAQMKHMGNKQFGLNSHVNSTSLLETPIQNSNVKTLHYDLNNTYHKANLKLKADVITPTNLWLNFILVSKRFKDQ